MSVLKGRDVMDMEGFAEDVLKGGHIQFGLELVTRSIMEFYMAETF